MRARWTAAGAGRADAEAHGADAGDGVLVTECWDTSFDEVYAQGFTSDGGVASEGNPSSCAFLEPLR